MRTRIERRTGALLTTMAVAALVWVPSAGSAAVGGFSDDDGDVRESNIEAIAAAGITAGCNPPDGRYDIGSVPDLQIMWSISGPD